MTPAQLIVLVGTILTGITGCITAYAAIMRAKKESRTEMEIECLNRLKIARLDEEALRDELIALKRKLA